MWWMPSIFGAALAGATIAGTADPTTGRVQSFPALDVVLHGTAPLAEAHRARLREGVTRIWAAAGIVLRWPEHAHGPRAHVTVHIDWAPRRPTFSCVAPAVLGSMIVVDGRPSPDTIVVSAHAASELVRCGRMGDNPLSALPGVLREWLIVRVLARVIAHEIGHYVLGPAHADHGIMRARLTRAELVEPLPTRYRWPSPRHAPRAP